MAGIDRNLCKTICLPHETLGLGCNNHSRKAFHLYANKCCGMAPRLVLEFLPWRGSDPTWTGSFLRCISDSRLERMSFLFLSIE